ncbi:hypothetical protein ABW20_dc0105585 [Dactylellina cionopaga]|nr:hypothetical protein ABW20_dc0105585 [Dactylellina cionopaga]
MASEAPSQAISPAPTIINVTPLDDKTFDSNVALVALILSATALLAAVSQALLQYLTSAQRDKCLVGAIGGWSAFTRTGWDFGRWRIRVRYARLKFDVPNMLAAAGLHRFYLEHWIDRNFNFSGRYILGPVMKDIGWQPQLLSYGGVMILDPQNQPVTFWDLTQSQKMSWIWFYIRSYINKAPGSLWVTTTSVRAGWSNLLAALQVSPDKRLIDGFEDADIIPSTADAPMQRIQLGELCLLCHMVNIKDIYLDAAKGTIEGQSPFIKVGTQVMPGVGQAVAFSGDFAQLREQLVLARYDQLFEVYKVARGRILGHKFHPDGRYFDEGAFLYGLSRNWYEHNWFAYQNLINANVLINPSDGPDFIKYIHKISPVQSARRYSEELLITPKAWPEIWVDIIGGCSPTLLKYYAMMPFMEIWSAAPLELHCKPYWPYLEERRRTWYRDQFQRLYNMPLLAQHPQMEFALAFRQIPFLRKSANSFHLLVSGTRSVPRNYTWAWYPNIPILQLWDSDVTKHTCEQVDDARLYLPAAVLKILAGDPQIGYNVGLKEPDSLESAIVLSLLIVDCRLQTLWTLIEGPEGAFGRFYAKVREIRARSISNDRKTALVDDLMRKTWREPRIETIEFMTVWFELGRRADIIGDTGYLQLHVAQILDDWRTEDGPCIPEIPRDFENIPGDIMDGVKNGLDMFKSRVRGAKTRSEFAEWAAGKNEDGSSRLDLIQKMIPLLQLRIFLMDLSFRCYSDSSKIVPLLENATVNVQLV